MTDATFTLCSLRFIRRRAERTDFVDVDADGFVILAKDNARDIVGCVLGADVGVQWDVGGAFEVVGVLVETHFALAFWVNGSVGLLVLGGLVVMRR